jgi:hypothetical protein
VGGEIIMIWHERTSRDFDTIDRKTPVLRSVALVKIQSNLGKQ